MCTLLISLRNGVHHPELLMRNPWENTAATLSSGMGADSVFLDTQH